MAVSTQTQTCIWTGASGKEYIYLVYRLPVNFNPNQPGNYIYTRVDADNQWVPIYIGQGDLRDRATSHHQADCIRRKGATHFHCHNNAVEQNRLAEESDLLANHPQAYQPTGCNERRGG